MAARSNRFGAAAALRSGPTPTPGSDGEALRAYTLRLTTTAANNLDEDLLALRRRVGKKIDKSEVMRILLDMLHEDPTVSETVATRLAH